MGIEDILLDKEKIRAINKYTDPEKEIHIFMDNDLGIIIIFDEDDEKERFYYDLIDKVKSNQRYIELRIPLDAGVARFY